jgi:uncharacterized protein YkwD
MTGLRPTYRPFLIGSAVLAAVLALTVIPRLGPRVTPPAGAPSSGRCPNQTADPTTISTAQLAGAIACLVNHERSSHGLTRLQANVNLHNAAYGHSVDMRRRNYFSHVSPSGSTVRTRAFRSNYLPGDGRWKVGEDLAAGRGSGASPRAIVSSWMNSPPHRREILTSSYRNIGIGISRGSPRGADEPGTVTITANFGHR